MAEMQAVMQAVTQGTINAESVVVKEMTEVGAQQKEILKEV